MACLVNVHFSDIPHTFIPHFTLHSAEKIGIEFSANYPLTTFRIPQNTPSPCRSPIFEFPSRKATTRVQTSWNVDISRNSDGHILVVREAAVGKMRNCGMRNAEGKMLKAEWNVRKVIVQPLQSLVTSVLVISVLGPICMSVSVLSHFGPKTEVT